MSDYKLDGIAVRGFDMPVEGRQAWQRQEFIKAISLVSSVGCSLSRLRGCVARSGTRQR